MAGETLLVVEDDPLIGEAVQERLSKAGYDTTLASSGGCALDLLDRQDYDLLLLDNRLPDTTGLKLFCQLKERSPETLAILMSAYSTVQDAVEAMKLGAFHYLVKPFNMDEMLLLVHNALETTRLRREVRLLRDQNWKRFGTHRILGQDPGMLEILGLVEKVVEHGARTLLITGESGTGKDLLAKTVHQSGPRASAPYMNITCSALPLHLLESELFGHERGSFTDAREQKKGLLEVARNGTVLLDEIGDMPLPLQAKMLRFLEDRAFKRIGGTSDIQVDVQIIAATHRDLQQMVVNGAFRNDLYYRLSVIPIHIPPLRERRGDIPLLVGHFIENLNREFHRGYEAPTPEVLALLEAYHWPGNVRELRNVLERAFILGDGEQIRSDDLPIEIRNPWGATRGRRQTFTLPLEGVVLEEVEQDLVQQALELAEGNQTQAARLLGMTRDQIKYRLKKYRAERKRAAARSTPAS